jgi:hypothetical protein
MKESSNKRETVLPVCFLHAIGSLLTSLLIQIRVIQSSEKVDLHLCPFALPSSTVVIYIYIYIYSALFTGNGGMVSRNLQALHPSLI